MVLRTADPAAAMDFYTRVVGLAPVRFDEFAAGDAPFPSVRVCEDSIIDLSPIDDVEGHRVNHVCLTMTKAEFDALVQRLHAEGIDTGDRRLAPTYGARGWGPEGMYFPDPDGNVIEARYYD